MPESTRRETQLGLADLTKRLSARGIEILETRRSTGLSNSKYFAIGSAEHQTDITISDEFLDDLPGTKEYHAIVDSYADAVAGRLKCGNPEVFYCRSGVAVQIAIRWPIQSAVVNNVFRSPVLIEVRNIQDEKFALCSIELGFGFHKTAFEIVLLTINSVRKAIDDGTVNFYPADVHQKMYQQIPRNGEPSVCSQSEVVQFVAGKAYELGFMAANSLTEIWAVDPWDAQYLGVTAKDLSLAMRVLRANGLLEAGTSPEHVRPTDKLLAERSSRTKEDAPLSRSKQKLSHNSPPAKDELLKDLQHVIKHHPTFALVVLDVDNFKSVNDTKGHLEGNKCLDKFIEAVETVVGGRGKVYRWGGDEFAICLPDYSTAEALTTAERIRSAVEQAKAGGDIEVTTSVGVCGSDCLESNSPEEFFNFADKAMYKSKHSGKNRVTSWPISSAGLTAENMPTKRLGEQERNKLAESVVLSIKTENGQQRNYTIRIKNHSKEFDVAIKRISLWSDGQRVGEPAFRPEGENARCWDVGADRELPINFDAGEVVAKRLWLIAGSPSMDMFHDANLLKGHFRSKVRVDVLYEVVGMEKPYAEARTVQVDPINNVITGI